MGTFSNPGRRARRHLHYRLPEELAREAANVSKARPFETQGTG